MTDSADSKDIDISHTTQIFSIEFITYYKSRRTWRLSHQFSDTKDFAWITQNLCTIMFEQLYSWRLIHQFGDTKAASWFTNRYVLLPKLLCISEHPSSGKQPLLTMITIFIITIQRYSFITHLVNWHWKVTAISCGYI